MVPPARREDPAAHAARRDPGQRRRLTEQAGRRIARNTLYNVVGQALPLLLGLAAIPITLRALGAARFGLLGLAWAILGYVGVLDLGLGRATTKFVAEHLAAGDKLRLERIATLAVAGQTVAAALGGVLLALVAPLLAGRVLGVPPALHAEARGMLLVLALSVPFVVLSASLRAILEAAQRFDLVNLIRTPMSAAVLLIPAVVAPLGAGLPTIVLLLLLARIVACGITAALVPRAIPGFRWALDVRWETLRPLLGYGGWVSVSNVASPVLVYLERFLLASLVGVAAVGAYTAPAEAVQRLLIVPAGLASALFPVVSASGPATGGRETPDSVERLLGRPLRFLLLSLAPIVILLVAGANPLVRLWLGSHYASQSTAAFAILAAGVLVNGLAHIPYAYLLARGRPDLPAKFHLLELPLYVALGLLLIRRLGVTGAALAWTLRVTVDAALLVLGVWSVADVAPGRLLGVRGGRAAAAVALLAAAAAGCALLAPGAAIRGALLALVTAAFAIGVWRFVLNDVERGGLWRVFS
jgi:O-antigen/teichoic acid export membrane protein